MIPVIGSGAAAVIAGLVAIHSAAGVGAIIAYALYATALRISIDQLFGPLALGTAARLHPVLVIFCFLSGALLFGIVGVIMAVPVALVVKITLALSMTSRSRMRWQANESSSAEGRAQRRKCQKVDATFSAFGGF
jgi:predicted PurR-regulated permease PerM